VNGAAGGWATATNLMRPVSRFGGSDSLAPGLGLAADGVPPAPAAEAGVDPDPDPEVWVGGAGVAPVWFATCLAAARACA